MRVSRVLTLLVGAVSAVALAQDPSQSSTDRESDQSSETRQTATQTTTTETSAAISGTVVRYEPGRVIVIRDASNQERTFNLGPGVAAPVDVRVGSYVNLSTETNGVNVTRIRSGTMPSGGASGTGMSGSGTSTWSGTTGTTPGAGSPTLPRTGTGTTTGTTSGSGTMTSDPQSGTRVQTGTTTSTTGTQSGTVRKDLPRTGTSGSMTATEGSWISGTVTAYTPGQFVTIAMPGGTTVEYRIDSSSSIPTDLAIGKTVKIQSDVGMEGSQRVVKQLQYTTKTTTKSKKTSSTHIH